MEEKNEAATLFNYLRPVAVNVAKDPSISNLKAFIEIISKLENKSINENNLLEYLFFPFKLSLKQGHKLKEQQEILCFQCLKVLIQKSNPTILTYSILLWIFNLFSVFFGSHELSKEKGNEKEISEEQQLSLLELFSVCTHSINEDPFIKLYLEENRMPLIGHVFSILLDILLNERNQSLQLVSIQSILNICGINFTEDIQKDIFGTIVCSFLPGISSKVRYLFNSKNNAGHKVFVDILNMFAHVIVIVLYDRKKEKKENLKLLFESTPQVYKEDSNKDTKNLKIDKTEEWLDLTSNNLSIILKDIFAIALANKHPKVQMALLCFVDKITSSCMENLASIIPNCIDVLVKSSVSDIDEVKARSNKILKRCNKTFSQKDISKTRSLLDKRFFTLLVSLPRIMNSVNEDIKLAKLQMFQGYLHFYGDIIKSILMSAAQLDKVLTCILQILELETKDISLVKEKQADSYLTWDTAHSMADLNYFKKKFKHFRDQSIYNALLEIIKELSLCSDINVLIDYLQEKIRYSDMYRNESILLLNYVLLYSTCNRDEKSAIMDMLIDLYMSKELFSIRTSNQNKSTKAISPESVEHFIEESLSIEGLNRNVQTICLLIEGIGIFAQALKEDFNIYFIQVLYPLLEKVGSTNANIHEAAMECCKVIVNHCGYKDIPHLIEANSDYLLNAITLEFRRFKVNSTAAAVFCVVLQFCKTDLLLIVADATEDVLKNLDEYQDEVASELLLVLKMFSMAVSEWYVIENKDDMRNTKVMYQGSSDLQNDNISVKDFMLLYFCTFNHAMGNVNEDDECCSDEMETNNADHNDDSQNEKKIIPLYFAVVIKALERCVYYLSSENINVKYRALEVTYHGVLALRKREDDLLPILHKLWPAIIIQLKSNDEVTILKTIDVLVAMIEHSGDFMRKRISKEFIGHCLGILKRNEEKLLPNKSMYLQLHKVIMRIISFLGNVIPTLKIDKELLCDAISSIVPYLDARLHSDVQEVAIKTVKRCLIYDYCVTWLLLNTFLGEHFTNGDMEVGLFDELQFVNEPKKYLRKNIVAILQQ